MKKIKFDAKANSIVTRTDVEGPAGKLNVTLILDTGATYVHLPWRILQALGYDLTTVSTKEKIITASGVEIAPKLRVKKLTAFGVERKNVEVVCHDLPPECRVDGLIGLSFLRYFNIHLKFKTGIIEIE